ncbi:PH domain-containing protein [Pirellulaceae bacterium SH449]
MPDSQEQGPVDSILKATAEAAAKAPVVEQELWKGAFVSKAMYSYWLACGILSVALVVGGVFSGSLLGESVSATTVWSIVAGLIALLWIWAGGLCLYRKLSVNYVLTTQRLIHRHGILIRTTDRIELIEVDDVSFTQGIVERMLNVGKIRVTSSDRSHPVLFMYGIEDVAKVSNQIDDARRTERRRRALMINQGS